MSGGLSMDFILHTSTGSYPLKVGMSTTPELTYEEIIEWATKENSLPKLAPSRRYKMVLNEYFVVRGTIFHTVEYVSTGYSTVLREGQTLAGTNLSGIRNWNERSRYCVKCVLTLEPRPQQSSSPPAWLSLAETYGTNLLVTTATLASIIQGLDVVERRWREHSEKQRQQSAQASSTLSPQPAASSSPTTSVAEKEITEIRLVMDDGSHHSLTRWVSDPDTLRAYIDAFSDSTSKVKPLQVTFMKREGRALVVDITEGGKDNPQLNVILGYLES